MERRPIHQEHSNAPSRSMPQQPRIKLERKTRGGKTENKERISV